MRGEVVGVDRVLIEVVSVGAGGRVPRLAPTKGHVGRLEGRALSPLTDQFVRVLHRLAVEHTAPGPRRRCDRRDDHQVHHPTAELVLLSDVTHRSRDCIWLRVRCLS